MSHEIMRAFVIIITVFKIERVMILYIVVYRREYSRT